MRTSWPPPRKAEPKAAGLKLPWRGGPGGRVPPAGREGPVLRLPVRFVGLVKNQGRAGGTKGPTAVAPSL